jgi:hypothetical protein
VEICDFQIRDLDYFESEFRARKQVKKLAGSRPIKFYVVKLSNSRAQEQLYLGQDSRNPSLFWIYPSIEPSLISQLGFMNLNYDFSSIRCNFIKQSWVEKAFVW